MASVATRFDTNGASGSDSLFDTTQIRVGDRVELWTLPTAGPLPVIGMAGAHNVWVPNVDNIPFIASVRHIVRRTPRDSKYGWYFRPGSGELERFEYDLGHPLMSSDPPRDARFFASEAAAASHLMQRLDEEYRLAAAAAAWARERLVALADRYAMRLPPPTDERILPSLQ